MKRSRKAEDILKEDCQAFGTIIAKALTLDNRRMLIKYQTQLVLQI